MGRDIAIQKKLLNVAAPGAGPRGRAKRMWLHLKKENRKIQNLTEALMEETAEERRQIENTSQLCIKTRRKERHLRGHTALGRRKKQSVT